MIDGLESAKITSNDINAKAVVAKATEAQIVESRKAYVPVATRAALLYFLIDQMWGLDHMYRFSMASFVTIFIKGMDRADQPGGGDVHKSDTSSTASEEEQDEEVDTAPPVPPASGVASVAGAEAVGVSGGQALKDRVNMLTDTSSFACFNFVAQSLFERHKLIFACQLCFRILAVSRPFALGFSFRSFRRTLSFCLTLSHFLSFSHPLTTDSHPHSHSDQSMPHPSLPLQAAGEIPPDLFDFLLRGTAEVGLDNPLGEWMDDKSWGGVQAIKQFEVFEKLADDLLSNPKRFREWYEMERPEDAHLPGDWKKLGEFHKLIVVRALRPDRTSEALSIFVKAMLGTKYVESRVFNLKHSFDDASPSTPVFFILSPGVDPVRDTERLAKEFRVSFDLGNFSLVSLGQGQEPVAEKAVDTGSLHGQWAFLQNIHLTPKWTSSWLEKRVEDLEGSHADFRLFLSAEPALLPVNLLQV